MKFTSSGSPRNPAVLLIHAMFLSEHMFQAVTSLLEEQYLVIRPTLDSHDVSDNSEFLSAQDEAAKILRYLQDHRITELEILAGISLGGIVAFEVFRQNLIPVRRVFLDGAPFIRLSGFRIAFMTYVFQWIAHTSARYPDKKNVLDKLFPAHAEEMKRICAKISDTSIGNLAKACYTCELPDAISLNDGQSLTFLYGTKEKASMCIPSLKKYTTCRLLIKEGYHHCEFLSKEPGKYAEMLTCEKPHNIKPAESP